MNDHRSFVSPTFLTLAALLTAFTAVATMFLKIPMGAGYYHLGDGVYFASALVFGPWLGALAGGLGGMLADVAGGYPQWAPITLILKGAGGYLAGRVASGQASWRRQLLGLLTAGLLTVVGYPLTAWYFFGIPFALIELYGNLGQVAAGIVAAFPLASLLRRINTPSRIGSS